MSEDLNSGFVTLIEGTRSIFIGDSINSKTATAVIIHLLKLDSESQEDITLYINSPGGSISDGLAIYDTMELIKSDVRTICVGRAASMGSFLLACGAKGKRYALPHSEVMIHQPIMGIGYSQETNIQILANHIANTREILEAIYAEKTGKPVEQIHLDCERDKYLSPQEALEYGLIDKILETEK